MELEPIDINMMLDAVKEHCRLTKRKASTVGNYAVNDGGFFERLQNGGSCNVDTYNKVIRWLDKNKPTPHKGAR